MTLNDNVPFELLLSSLTLFHWSSSTWMCLASFLQCLDIFTAYWRGERYWRSLALLEYVSWYLKSIIGWCWFTVFVHHTSIMSPELDQTLLEISRKCKVSERTVPFTLLLWWGDNFRLSFWDSCIGQSSTVWVNLAISRRFMTEVCSHMELIIVDHSAILVNAIQQAPISHFAMLGLEKSWSWLDTLNTVSFVVCILPNTSWFKLQFLGAFNQSCRRIQTHFEVERRNSGLSGKYHISGCHL